MHVVSLHSWSSFQRHSSVEAFEKSLQHAPGLFPGEKLTHGFRMPAGWREFLGLLRGWLEQIRASWFNLRGSFNPNRLHRLLFTQLELVPAIEEPIPWLPVIVEDGEKVNWQENGRDLLGGHSPTRLLLLSNHAHPVSIPEEIRKNGILSIDTRKPWVALAEEIRRLVSEAEPVLYHLRMHRLASFTARENRVYILKRNGTGDGQIRDLLHIPPHRFPGILASMARKLGVHEQEIGNFEPEGPRTPLVTPRNKRRKKP